MPNRHQYTVGWICAIPVELVAAKLFLDERHGKVEDQPLEDNNIYTLGKIGDHNVVVASLPDGEYGTEVAGTVARDLLRSFPNVKVGLMVGIGGGVPSAKHDVRLGDVVVSATRNGEPGVFQYDFGKTIQDGAFQHTRFLDQTPRLLRSAVAEVRSEYDIVGHRFNSTIDAILEKNRKVRKTHQRPPEDTDRLYTSSFAHPPDGAECEKSCGDDKSVLKLRLPRDEDEDDPAIHYGLIASGNSLMKDAKVRDQLAEAKDVLCFEMEAAGLTNHFPCLVIRGICDYADSHKKKGWQGYAAMTAAAYAKDVLNCIPARQVQLETPIANALDALANDVNEILDETHERDRLNILDWITSKDYGPEHSNRLEQRERGTGQWFLNSKNFKSWLESNSQTLFCPGIPGAGKTILASIVIDYIGSNLRDNPDASLAYIYFDHIQKDQHTTKALVTSLLKQLAASHSVLPETVNELYKAHSQKRTRPSMDEYIRCLRAIVDARSKVFIVLDALDECTSGSDECEDRSLHKFLDVIFQLQVTGNVNLLATSRFIPDISKRFDAALVQEVRASSDDITSYVSTEVKLMGGKIKGDDELQAVIKKTILEAVDGMFLMARLYIQSLRACMMTKRKVKEALERFARQQFASDTNRTHRAYDEAVLRIDSQNKEYQITARHALLWITYAERPLTANELIHALAVEGGKPSFDEDNVAHIEDVVSVCAGLVALDDKSGIIRLVHYTAYEYFQGTRPDWFQKTHSDITSLCVTYLSYDIFTSDPEFSELPEFPGEFTPPRRTKAYHLYSYAAAYWGHHARRAGASAVDTCMIKFLDNAHQVKASWAALLAAQNAEGKWPYAMHNTQATGIHLASYFGIQEAVQRLLAKEGNANHDDGAGWTPLSYAAYGGQELMIQLLLENASENSEEFSSQALNVAMNFGQEGAAVRFIERGAGIHSNERRSHFVHSAAQHGMYLALERLLSLGADPNMVDRFLFPLRAAASRGCEKSVTLLLGRGCRIDDCDEISGTALKAAVKSNQTKIVELLLDHGADPNIGASYVASTPLWSAADIGHAEVVLPLIERGANINVIGDWGTPLSQAAAKGHADIVRILLDRGADIDLPDMRGNTPLCRAAGARHTEVIQLLLDRGAEISAVNHKGDSPLHMAAEVERLASFQPLLHRGAYFGATNKKRDSPLNWAARWGHIASVRLLLKYGANVDAANSRGSTALHGAARFGDVATVRLLLRRGAKINAADRRNMTPLCTASYDHRVPVIRGLINSGADVNAVDDWGNTPLMCAVSTLSTDTWPLLYIDREGRYPCYPWRMTVIQLLIGCGANVGTQNALGNTALHIAAGASDKNVVMELIQLGADINARNSCGQTAFYAVGLKIPRYRDCVQFWRDEHQALGSLSPYQSSPNSSSFHARSCGPPDRGDAAWTDDESGRISDGRGETADQTFSWQSETSSARGCGSVVWSPDLERLSIRPRSGAVEYIVWQPASSLRGYEEVFKCLLAMGTGVDLVDEHGLTLLWRLACAGDGEVVQQLLQNGADTEAKDSHRRTTLHMSALNGKLDVVELLLTYKAEIEAVDEEGRTPLWVAAWSGTAGVVQLLLDHGANSEAMDTHSRTPLQVAVMKSHDDVDWILSWRGSSDAACVGLQRLFSEADDASAYPHQSLNP